MVTSEIYHLDSTKYIFSAEQENINGGDVGEEVTETHAVENYF